MSTRRLVHSVLAAAAAFTAASTIVAPASAEQARVVRSRDATYATVLGGRIPCPFDEGWPELGCGRMRNGRLPGADRVIPGAHVNVKNITGKWRTTSVRFADVAGDRRKEAVVIISASAGGVAWPNTVIVYDGNGKIVNVWDSGAATGGDAREGTKFGRARTNSVDVRVDGIPKAGEGACCGTGSNVYRLYKNGRGKAAWRLLSAA